jgi:proline iminopeptidase
MSGQKLEVTGLLSNINKHNIKMKKFVLIIFVVLFFSSCEKLEVTEPGALVPKTVDQDPSLPSLFINGTLLHVESSGDPGNPIIIIIHGGPGADYRSMINARQLTNDGYYVIFYDQRGTGLSQRVDRSTFNKEGSIEIYFDDLLALIDHFRLNDAQKVFLAGHSWGAMLATGFVNRHPSLISGLILAEPGGFTWPQVEEYFNHSMKIKIFSEELNDALFPEQIFAGMNEHEVLDYKSAIFASYENAPGNPLGNSGPYPFWRNGAVANDASIEYAVKFGFDFTTNLNQFTPKILFLYSEYSKAYGYEWARTVSAPYPNVDLQMVKGTGHEMFYFGWEDMYPRIQNYLNELR